MFCFPNSDHVMFSKKFTICLFINYTYICRCMHIHRTTFERNSSLGYHLTRSEMEKQNTQATKVYYNMLAFVYHD